MANLWERFEGIAKPEEVEAAKSQFEPLPAGLYEMTLESIEAGESKDGLPMLKGKLRTSENRVVFYNQMLQNLNFPNMTAVNIGEAVTFVSGLLGEEVDFQGMGAFGELIPTIPVGGTYSVRLTYGKNDTDMKFPKLRIEEPIKLAEVDNDIPF